MSTEYGEQESRNTERAYQSPEIVAQREHTLAVLAPGPGEHIVDVGCGPGLLAAALADATGREGRVTGVDMSTAMLTLAGNRLAGRGNVTLVEGDATALDLDDDCAEALVCTQVLLYVAEPDAAIAEFARVLRPGGRLVIMETDWRSAVLHSGDEALTERIIEAWDCEVPSPRLPARLRPMLARAGFDHVAVDVFPIVSTAAEPGGYAMSMATQCADAARTQGVIDDDAGREWLNSLVALAAQDAFFFSVNRYLFSAVLA